MLLYLFLMDKKAIYSWMFMPFHDISQQCFSESSTRRPADLLSSFTTIKTVANNLYDGLTEVLKCLLKNTNTRETVLEYLAEVINKNASRAHLQVINLFFLPGRTERLFYCSFFTLILTFDILL